MYSQNVFVSLAICLPSPFANVLISDFSPSVSVKVQKITTILYGNCRLCVLVCLSAVCVYFSAFI